MVAFQSTLPARGATTNRTDRNYSTAISIHAPRTGSDTSHKFLFVQHPISIHAPRTGSDLYAIGKLRLCIISIHAPRTGSDYAAAQGYTVVHISIHAPRTGSDFCKSCRLIINNDFNPRSPHGERRSGVYATRYSIQFQSTLPARGATERFRRVLQAMSISIHAPRTGSDTKGTIQARLNTIISIHAPRTGSDKASINSRLSDLISIHAPRTGSDSSPRFPAESTAYFNPRSPHGERPADAQQHDHKAWISIHAPRTGSDLNSIRWHGLLALFQSTLPARGATPTRYASPRGYRDFNPRSPHGERRTTIFFAIRLNLFQSTLPARGATTAHRQNCPSQAHFNPRSPHGERPRTES